MTDAGTTSSSCFPTTQWTQVIEVIQSGNDAAAWGAMASFCQNYRAAINKFFLRRGCPPHQAEDLTQEFFLKKIITPWSERKSFLHQAERKVHQRFRSFLCWMLWNFLKEDYKAERSQRAGGKLTHLSLEEWLPFEEHNEAKSYSAFGREFDYVFAQQIIQNAAARSKYSKHLEAHFRDEITQQQAADGLGISKEAFKLAYHRFRQQLAKDLRAEVAKLAGPEEQEIQAEIKYLISLFGQPRA